MRWRKWNWLDGALLPVAFAVLRSAGLWPWLEVLRHRLAPSLAAPLLPLGALVLLALCGFAAGRAAPGPAQGTVGPEPSSRRDAETQSEERLPKSPRLRKSEEPERSPRLRVSAREFVPPFSHPGWASVLRTMLVLTGLAAVLLTVWRRFWPGYGLLDGRWLLDLGRQLLYWHGRFPAPLLLMAAAALQWWRGARDGAQRLDAEAAWQAFAWAAGALAAALAVAAGGRLPLAPEIASVIVLFFTVSMFALAATALFQPGSGGRATPPGRYWWASMLSAVAVLLGVGLLLSWLVAPASIARALAWLAVPADLAGRVLYWLLAAFARVAGWVLQPLVDWLLAHYRPQLQEGAGALGGMDELVRKLREEPAAAAVTPPALRWLGLALLAALTFWLLRRALRRWRARDADEVDETRDSVFSRSLLAAQLAALWKTRRAAHRPAPGAPYLALDGEAPTRRSIRTVYQALLAWARSRGEGRRRGQTPAALARTLAGQHPAAAQPLAAITAGYERARYAAEPPAEEEADAVRKAWEELKGGPL